MRFVCIFTFAGWHDVRPRLVLEAYDDGRPDQPVARGAGEHDAGPVAPVVGLHADVPVLQVHGLALDH